MTEQVGMPKAMEHIRYGSIYRGIDGCIVCPEPDRCKDFQKYNYECPCTPKCPQCLNEQWARWLVGRWNGTTYDKSVVGEHYAIVAIPMADFEALKKMAEGE